MREAVLQTKVGYNQYSACRVTPQKAQGTPKPAAPAAGYKTQPLIALHVVHHWLRWGLRESQEWSKRYFQANADSNLAPVLSLELLNKRFRLAAACLGSIDP